MDALICGRCGAGPYTTAESMDNHQSIHAEMDVLDKTAQRSLSIEDFRKKYGTEVVILMIDHLLYKVTLSPYAAAQYDELKQDLRALLATR